MLAAAVTVVTLGASLALLRAFAPGLLGLPTDLQLVRVAKEAPAFFDNVLNASDFELQGLLLNDPISIVRGQPLLQDRGVVGPHDVLGFRNLAVPNHADIVILGDSQTYGNSLPLRLGWPSVFARSLGNENVTVYTMALGGWAAVQYLYMVTKLTAFTPSLVIVAFYTGNDALESFKVAYGDSRWADLRPDPELEASDAPAIVFPVPESDVWTVELSGERKISFQPELRLATNMDHPAVDAGYGVMRNAAREMVRLLSSSEITVLFTIIPTKELAFAPLLEREGVTLAPKYAALIDAERRRIAWLEGELRKIPGAAYAPIVEALQQGVLENSELYFSVADGHPNAPGHQRIGETLARAVEPAS